MLPGPTELALILVIILIVFGAGKLPQVMKSLGEGVKMFREAQNNPDGTPRDVTPGAREIPANPSAADAEVVESDKAPAR